MPAVNNWFGDVVSNPRVIVDAASVDDVVAVLRDPVKYPSPVRAVGSNHSVSECGAAERGTLIRMSGLNKILDIGADTVTVQAGALYIDIAKELEKRNLQFYVNTEIGSLSAGSAACCGTKDASMPGELGQVGSYVSRIRMVLPSGELLDVSDDQPELMQMVRSSYGTFGIVYEVTFRVRPLAALAVHHETFALDEFVARLPELKARGESMMFYIFPFDDAITVEFRHYNPGATGQPDRHVWALRNYFWAKSGPRLAAEAEEHIPFPGVRYKIIDGLSATWRFQLENIVRSDYTMPADQIIRYPLTSDESRYTFSLWAFPEETYGAVFREHMQFCRKYFEDTGYRTNLLFVGYWIAKDQNALLSYSYDGPVMTIDPVSTGNKGWKEFLAAYNEFCSEHGGIPLFNQTFGLTRAQLQKALGPRLQKFIAARRQYDPEGRLLNDYFRDLLAESDQAAAG